jgi:hypothetical protein
MNKKPALEHKKANSAGVGVRFCCLGSDPVALLRIRYENKDALRLLSGQAFDDAWEALSVLPDCSA